MKRRNRVMDALYHIDLDNHTLASKQIDEGDLDEYVIDLIEKILSTPNNRFFDIASENTEVVAAANKIMSGEQKPEENKKAFDIIAERLLRIEIAAKEKYQNITELQRGSLIQSIIEIENSDEFYLLLVKVEHEAFLNTEDLVKQIGLPYDKRVLKTCLFKYIDKEVVEIIITDTNNRISAYWWNDFLELLEKNSDEHNTKTAFLSIEQVLNRKVKKQSPADYTILRNNLIGYFRTQENFVFDRMVDVVFGSYQPENETEINIATIKEQVLSLPKSKNFDRHFSIVGQEIKARIKKTIKISDKIDLNLKDHISELRHIIRSEETPNGEKQIVIKTDNAEAYNLFKYREEG